jgi:glucoamylase
MAEMHDHAPGWPGRPATWTSSAKSGVGTARNLVSRLWFTISHGILNEIYFPRMDTACTRDLGMIVTDGHSFFSEEKRHTTCQVSYVEEGVPAFRLVNTCIQGRYRIEKEILADPRRDVLLQHTRFVPLQGTLQDYRLYVLLSPHIGNHGNDNTAWVGDYKGVPVLIAQRRDGAVAGTLQDISLALAASSGWRERSVGFVGVSDGWQDLSANFRLTSCYARAENGNVAMVGEIDLQGGDTFTLALGFAGLPEAAAHCALASVHTNFDEIRQRYVAAWRDWQASLLPLEQTEVRQPDLYRSSTAVLRTHESKEFVGGFCASLSIPWGMSKGDNDLGGYHLVWPRDLVETAGGLLAAGARDDASRVLRYLVITQEADGHWPQNMWLDGRPYWDGVQMDETAFPILFVDLARREGALTRDLQERLWPMVRKAAGFLVRNGPVTQQDRWEEDAGFSPFTLAVEIAALLCAADIADLHGEVSMAAYLRETADAWNANIERWVYTSNTALCRRFDVDGYYVRIAPPEEAEAASPAAGFVPIKNRPPGHSSAPAAEIVSPDALALVRFGLRAANDPRIVNTVRVIDGLLKVETPRGTSWYRYNEDGYGEHEDGAPFDGTGIGRAWPLLTGERAHYELAAGRRDQVEKLLAAMEAFAGDGGLLPEQIWDGPDIPERELFLGRPSGSAMPLVWAHSEYIKLRRSLQEGRVFDMPPQTVERYILEDTGSPHFSWRFNHKCQSMPAGKILRVELLAPATVHWTSDGWQTSADSATSASGLGIHLVDLPTRDLPSAARIEFTLHWTETARWQGENYSVRVE